MLPPRLPITSLLASVLLSSCSRPPAPTPFDLHMRQAQEHIKFHDNKRALGAIIAARDVDPTRYEAPALAAKVRLDTGSFLASQGGGPISGKTEFADARAALADARALAPASKQSELDAISASIDEADPQLPAPAWEGGTRTIASLALDLVPIAPGVFTMGLPNGDTPGAINHATETRVYISNGFWLGKTEVTRAQWQAIMERNPSHSKDADLPAENMSTEQAMKFCQILTKQELAAGRLPAGYAYTLPTSAQWEYACRAGSTGPYPGNLDAMGWYKENSGESKHPVAQKQANAWGLYDMHGNVWEWCSDWKGDSHPGGWSSDPKGRPFGAERVLRGGSFYSTAAECRSGHYMSFTAFAGFNHGGFRLALTPVVVPDAPR